jgi:hypothetical protein
MHLSSPYGGRGVHDQAAARLAEWREKTARPEVVKVGPHGYVHGWIKVGSSEHMDMDDMADNGYHVGVHLDDAYKHAQRGDTAGAARHLGYAQSAIEQYGDPNSSIMYTIGRIKGPIDAENRSRTLADDPYAQYLENNAIRSG